MGAWIEIGRIASRPVEKRSLLSWERGLKFSWIGMDPVVDVSLLSWERGLKFTGL